MLNAHQAFLASIADARQHTAIYDFLVNQIQVPAPFDDLLRGQIVICVSAFDKLLHDLIRIGMRDIFMGIRPTTPRFDNESISMSVHISIANATVPPKEYVFEKSIASKLSYLSFQHPDKINDGLSLIWKEAHKWNKIESAMQAPAGSASTKMKLISGRRNAIVHESDVDPVSNQKIPISRAECQDMTNFIESCGTAIYNLVK